MKICLFILGILFLTTIVVGETTEYNLLTFTTDQNVTLNVLCLDLSQPCNSSFSCYLTVYNPNWSLDFSDRLMSYVGGGLFNISLDYYTTTGDYKGYITCESPIVGESNKTDRSDFRVVDETDKGQYEVSQRMIAIIIGFIISSIYFFAMGFLNNGTGAKLLGYGLSFIELIMMFGILYADYLNYDLTLLLRINFLILLLIGLGLGIYTFFMNSVRLMDVKNNDQNKWDKNWG